MSSVSRVLGSAEVKPLHLGDDARAEAVKKLHRVPLEMAKAAVGAAIDVAIGDAPAKEYGHEGLISSVKSGEKVPEYLARIYADPVARRRLAFALLKDDEAVTVRTVIEFCERKAG